MLTYIADHVVPAGILLPDSVRHTAFYAVLATFVAINTVMFAALAIAKILPKTYITDWIPGRHHRAETRSIYPDGPKGPRPSPSP